MKRASSPRTTAEPSQSFHRQLNMYANRGGRGWYQRTGFDGPADLKIVYPPANVKPQG
jgi:hypothetical protein